MPRSFYFKAGKIICKMLDAACLYVGKPRKKWFGPDNAICVEYLDGRKDALVVLMPFCTANSRRVLKLPKRACRDDVQKNIVKTVLKALEKNDIFLYYDFFMSMMSNGKLRPVWIGEKYLSKGMCFETLVIDGDLNSTSGSWSAAL